MLNEKFPFKGVGETREQFRRRLDKVEEFLNSEDFGKSEDSLTNLAKAYRARAEDLVRRQGGRLPK